MRRAFALLSFAAVAAATPALASAALTAPLGQTVRIPISGSAADVVVGDPKIADVTVISPKALFVSGRGYGSTNVVVMDAAGRTLFNGRVMVPTPNTGQVTLHRGSEQSQVLCLPNCGAPIDSDDRKTVKAATVEAGSAPAPTPAAPAN